MMMAAPRPTNGAQVFTPREAQVADLLLSGAKREAIAGELGIHIRTVGFHIENLRAKTHADSFAQLVIACWKIRRY